jgi:hypothetical protein
VRLKVEAFQCDLCGHVWLPRNRKDVPKACARCKNPNWDKGRKKLPVGRPKKVKAARRPKKGKPVGQPKPGQPEGQPSASGLHPAAKSELSPECKRFQHAACKTAGCGCFCH